MEKLEENLEKIGNIGKNWEKIGKNMSSRKSVGEKLGKHLGKGWKRWIRHGKRWEKRALKWGSSGVKAWKVARFSCGNHGKNDATYDIYRSYF